MAVCVDAAGVRSISVAVDVHGDRATVWAAIATGAGVTSWMAPTEIDGRVGGEVVCSFGPGMVSRARIVEWDPPTGFRAESDDLGPDAPPFVTQWTVSEREGGGCRVTVQHSIDAPDDSYDAHLTGVEVGWPGFFRILALCLEHFPGQSAVTLATMRRSARPRADLWADLQAGLAAPPTGDTPRPPYAGRVVLDLHDGFDEQVVLLDEPCPGIALLSVWGGESVIVSVTCHLFGDGGAAVVERDQPLWNTWIEALCAV